MKTKILKLKIKYLEKTLLFHTSLLFLKIAFDEANEKNHAELAKQLNQFRKYMPTSLKDVHTENEPDYERYFYNLFFIELVSNIELFLVEVITLVVSKHPSKIGKQQVTLTNIVELKSINKIVEKACEEYLNGLTYKKPNDYKKEFLKLLSAADNFLDEEWPKFIEMKARRDIGVHNDWHINDTYIRKVSETDYALPSDLEYMYPTNDYIECSVEYAKNLYEKICTHIEKKYS